MVNADEFYGEYLKAEDLPDEGIGVTIRYAKPEPLDNKERIVVYFHELRKCLVLNKTNKDRIKELFKTSETDEWKDKQITLVKELVPFKGESVMAIRVKQSEGVKTPSSQSKKEAE